MTIKMSFTLPLIRYFMRTNHTEVYFHIVLEKVEKGVISTRFVSSGVQLGKHNMFTKLLFKPWLELLCNKLELRDTSWRVLRV